MYSSMYLLILKQLLLKTIILPNHHLLCILLNNLEPLNRFLLLLKGYGEMFNPHCIATKPGCLITLGGPGGLSSFESLQRGLYHFTAQGPATARIRSQCFICRYVLVRALCLRFSFCCCNETGSSKITSSVR